MLHNDEYFEKVDSALRVLFEREPHLRQRHDKFFRRQHPLRWEDHLCCDHTCGKPSEWEKNRPKRLNERIVPEAMDTYTDWEESAQNDIKVNEIVKSYLREAKQGFDVLKQGENKGSDTGLASLEEFIDEYVNKARKQCNCCKPCALVPVDPSMVYHYLSYAVKVNAFRNDEMGQHNEWKPCRCCRDVNAMNIVAADIKLKTFKGGTSDKYGAPNAE